MSKSKKRSYKVYTAWNYDKEEQDLNKQSENGWQLVKGGCFHSVFEKNNNVIYRHKIDFNGDMIKDSIEKQRYIDMFEEQGWEYINTTFNGWSYFRKVYNENIPEKEFDIYTDNSSYIEMLARWIRVARIIQIFEVLIMIFQFITTIIHQYSIDYFFFIWTLLLTLFLQFGVVQMQKKYKHC
ncbi:uncharacterized protein DUF2812 [Mobilisporobacter senegalensis]|uniref:Uncharacterized protein DUF2812 n=1 Tax=Mobilisporobacter senegalensis TaxID=1329262 RepID=A0A3N1X6H7_9FIRM|nr:DUF2812 domain-containing protein [Mobilisporobacter senegalensis]ROR22386.1 uncharacterized protein DUF2812 [Mobilisporobacter senegalensis]